MPKPHLFCSFSAKSYFITIFTVFIFSERRCDKASSVLRSHFSYLFSECLPGNEIQVLLMAQGSVLMTQKSFLIDPFCLSVVLALYSYHLFFLHTQTLGETVVVKCLESCRMKILLGPHDYPMQCQEPT